MSSSIACINPPNKDNGKALCRTSKISTLNPRVATTPRFAKALLSFFSLFLCNMCRIRTGDSGGALERVSRISLPVLEDSRTQHLHPLHLWHGVCEWVESYSRETQYGADIAGLRIIAIEEWCWSETSVKWVLSWIVHYLVEAGGLVGLAGWRCQAKYKTLLRFLSLLYFTARTVQREWKKSLHNCQCTFSLPLNPLHNPDTLPSFRLCKVTWNTAAT